jgi:hypothetical protein
MEQKFQNLHQILVLKLIEYPTNIPLVVLTNFIGARTVYLLEIRHFAGRVPI